MNTEALALSPAVGAKRKINKYSQSLTTSQLLMAVQQNAQKISKRLSDAFASPKPILRSSESSSRKPINVYAGVVVTSSRSSRRRISNTEATKAFAVATSGSQQSLDRNHSMDQTVHKASFCAVPRVDRVNSASTLIFIKI